MVFQDLGLKDSSLRAIERLGFTTPTEIQQKAIPLLMETDRDFIGQAQTGTGKTAAFTLPLLEKIDPKQEGIQALILAPTRELANQIQEEIQKLAFFDTIPSFVVYGGVPVWTQVKDLRKSRAKILVGTPGRVIDLMDRGDLDFTNCKYFILDEADEMLDMGFFDDVKMILKTVEKKFTWMFSATMPAPIKDLVDNEFNNPVMVKQEVRVLTADTVQQLYTLASGRNQIEALCRYLDYVQDIYAIIFCKTKIGAKELTDELIMRGYATDALHGDMAQDQRDITMKRFKDKKVQLLVCTDVAARGIDVSDLTHVVNFSLPQDNEAYVHRIGRTGRGGKKGISLSIVVPDEEYRLRQIERITKAPIEFFAIPTVSEIKKVLLDKSFKKLIAHSQLVDQQGFAQEDFEFFKTEFATMEKDDVLKAMFGMIYEQNLKQYKDAKDIEVRPRTQQSRGGSSTGGRSSNPGNEASIRFSVDVGRENGITAGDVIRMICKNTGLRGNEIGRISIKDTKTYFDVINVQMAQKTIGQSKKFRWNGTPVSIDLDGSAGPTTAAPQGYSSSRGSSGPREGYRSDRGPSTSGPRRTGSGTGNSSFAERSRRGGNTAEHPSYRY